MNAVERQFLEVQQAFPALERTGRRTLRGLLPFSATFNCENVQDAFNVEINTAQDFFAVAPTVKEVGGRMAAYTHINPDSTLCLGAPAAIQIAYRRSGSLMTFIQEQIIPYLFTFCIWERTGGFPYGELKHGGEGILQYYREDYFKVDSDLKVLRLLKINIDRTYNKQGLCLCGSGLSFKACHGVQVREIQRNQSYQQLSDDYRDALTAYVKKPEAQIP